MSEFLNAIWDAPKEDIISFLLNATGIVVVGTIVMVAVIILIWRVVAKRMF